MISPTTFLFASRTPAKGERARNMSRSFPSAWEQTSDINFYTALYLFQDLNLFTCHFDVLVIWSFTNPNPITRFRSYLSAAVKLPVKQCFWSTQPLEKYSEGKYCDGNWV